MSAPTLLFGGASTERLVSVASAQHVIAVLPHCVPWFLTVDGAVHRVGPEALAAHPRPFETPFTPAGTPDFRNLDAALDALAKDSVLVLALHGGEGENGELQRRFEARGLAFTGSGSAASACAFDKVRAKETVRRAGVRLAEAVVLAPKDAAAPAQARALLARAGRVVLKPVADGSSFGLHHAGTAEELEAALADVAKSGVAYLCEAFVSGTELTVGVVEDARGLRALPVSEVRVDPGAAFDYAGKYLGKGTKEITPAEVSPEVARAAQQIALDAHRAIGCEGYTRTDLIVGREGPVFLEINTLPGLTRASFIPQQLAAEGSSFRAFLESQIAFAQARQRAHASAQASAAR